MTEKPYASVWADLRGVSFQQGWLDADGIRTRFMSAGDPSKPLLLLLHGVGGHAEAYVRNFGAHGEHFWTVAIDMIGHGWTDKPDIPYQLPDYQRHVLAVLKALGRERAMISGESLGGWVATWMAVHHPQAVEKLVLNTSGGWTAHPAVMARIKTLSNQAASDPSWERIRARLEFLMCDPSTVTDDLIETRRAIYAQPGFAASMARIMCLQDMDIRRPNMITEGQYRGIKAPTLVVWTSHDPTATPEEGAQIADMIPGSRFIVMNQCGHWPQYEDAGLFNMVHVDFLLGKDISGYPGVRA
jgi:2-hydroxy-6-oxonona-2,4-dienedioate hydrolase